MNLFSIIKTGPVNKCPKILNLFKATYQFLLKIKWETNSDLLYTRVLAFFGILILSLRHKKIHYSLAPDCSIGCVRLLNKETVNDRKHLVAEIGTFISTVLLRNMLTKVVIKRFIFSMPVLINVIIINLDFLFTFFYLNIFNSKIEDLPFFLN